MGQQEARKKLVKKNGKTIKDYIRLMCHMPKSIRKNTKMISVILQKVGHYQKDCLKSKT